MKMEELRKLPGVLEGRIGLAGWTYFRNALNPSYDVYRSALDTIS